MPCPSPSRRADAPCGDSWRAFLPREWQALAVAPVDIREHRDYEVAATRCHGYDRAGAVCYYAHGYFVDELRSDDDEEYYPVIVRGEAVHAWRLHDGRWLVHRVEHACGDGAPGRGFYAFAEGCPR